LAREMELDLGDERRRRDRGIGADEARHVAFGHRAARRAATMPMRRIQPTKRLARNFERQSAASSVRTIAACQTKCTAVPKRASQIGQASAADAKDAAHSASVAA